MASDDPAIAEDTPTHSDSAQMQILHLSSTIWTQTTTFVESGKAQLPEVTIYTSLQPIEMASYPDPIMSATGADLTSLLALKHASAATVMTTTMASMETADNVTASEETTTVMASETAQGTRTDSVVHSSEVGDDVAWTTMEVPVPVTSTFEYITTQVYTAHPTKRAPLKDAAMRNSPKGYVTTSAETGSDTIPKGGATKPITFAVSHPVTTFLISNTRDVLGRAETVPVSPRPTPKPQPWQDSRDFDPPPPYTSFGGLSLLLWAPGAVFITLLTMHTMKKMYKRRKTTQDVAYTGKPPRPSLKKRLSLSMSMSRPTNVTQAVHVSGNALSIGRASGKVLKEAEIRRTPSTSLFEV